MKDKQYNQLMILSGEQIEDCPKQIRILPTGKVSSEKGEFFVDEESFRLMKNEMLRRGIDIVIDYEHQTLKDIQAPAGGWIKDIEWTPEAIIAKVEWTERAKEYLKNKEYRYLSPVILCRAKDSKAVVLHSVALTNTPAINGMFTIINSSDIENYNNEIRGGNKMDLKKLIGLLGLDEDATEEQVMAALEEKLKKKEDSKKEPEETPKQEEMNEQEKLVANSVILALLELPESAKTDEVAGKIMSLKAGETAVQRQVNELAQQLKERDAEDSVMKALKSGKITTAQYNWAKMYALNDKKGFESFLEKAPQVVPLEKISFEEKKEGKGAEVSALVLKACGVSKEDIEKFANKEEAGWAE